MSYPFPSYPLFLWFLTYLCFLRAILARGYFNLVHYPLLSFIVNGSLAMAPQAMTPDTRNEARQQQKLADPYLSNDFFPLNQAHNTVIAALRAEEASTDADLYRRIASDSASGTDEGRGHLYRSLEKDGTNGASPRGEKEGATAVGAGGTASVTCDVHPTLAHSQSIPLPNYITKVLKEAKLSSLMGILPEANMVWVSVDDTLYLWDYQRESVGGVGKTSNSNADDFVCFKVPSGQCVVSVGLVKPKLGKCRLYVQH
jgi:hypothetical protein